MDVENPCSICGGERIGAELDHLTCGHCGKRFVLPFLDDAHRNGHRGERMLRRFAMLRNSSRRLPGERITTIVLEAAVDAESRR